MVAQKKNYASKRDKVKLNSLCICTCTNTHTQPHSKWGSEISSCFVSAIFFFSFLNSKKCVREKRERAEGINAIIAVICDNWSCACFVILEHDSTKCCCRRCCCCCCAQWIYIISFIILHALKFSTIEQ